MSIFGFVALYLIVFRILFTKLVTMKPFMYLCLFLIAFVNFVSCETLTTTAASLKLGKKELLNNTRRIILGTTAADTRPYMVYLREVLEEGAQSENPTWLCGGVIIHERHILTSAACIENVQHFIVISGTHRYLRPEESNTCIQNGAKKAIWKCVPKDYVYDGRDFNNIRWMIGDIAVVKVDEPFNFKRKIKGCDYIPQKVAYNNDSIELEAHGRMASIAGWGSTEKYTNLESPSANTDGTGNTANLLETDVKIISKNICMKRWPERYHHIIRSEMICGKDAMDSETMSSICKEQHVDCKELVYDDDEEVIDYTDKKDNMEPKVSRRVLDPNHLTVHRPHEKLLNDSDLKALRRGAGGKFQKKLPVKTGGFCENDHGGPLIDGHGKTSKVIGIISATQTRENTMNCFGPFLFTSVYKYRNLISCSIFKETEASCLRLLLRSGNEATYNWDNPKLRL